MSAFVKPKAFRAALFHRGVMMPAYAPSGLILAPVVTALYAGLQMFLSLLLLPGAMLFCRLVRRTAA